MSSDSNPVISFTCCTEIRDSHFAASSSGILLFDFVSSAKICSTEKEENKITPKNTMEKNVMIIDFNEIFSCCFFISFNGLNHILSNVGAKKDFR